MRRINHRKKYNFYLIVVLALGLIFTVGCQGTNDSGPPATNNDQPGQDSKVVQEIQATEVTQEIHQDSTDADKTHETSSIADETASKPDPAAIEAAWQSSPHAYGFVQDANGDNNSCARCHAPINWAPSMDDLPESCYACKFELEQPPAYIPEDQWTSIPCNICHKPDKKGNIQSEIQWLEIAALEEYSPVETVTELCQKCHNPTNLPEHVAVQVGGAHAGYECTQCHDAHDTNGTCGGGDCHEDALAMDGGTPGHDADHRDVDCAACHDGLGLEVGPSEERGTWVTFSPWSYETVLSDNEIQKETGVVAFTSHNLVLEAKCERCHFVDNPWELSDQVEAP